MVSFQNLQKNLAMGKGGSTGTVVDVVMVLMARAPF
jgi:hypothetical protein